MKIVLYYNPDDNNVVSKRLEKIAEYDNVFSRDFLEIENPKIVIEGNIDRVNYAYIPNLRRYYYVTDTEHLRTGMSILKCHVDVLMSFADDIKSLTAIIDRSAGLWDAYLPDTEQRAEQYTKTACIAFKLSQTQPVIFAYSPNPILVTAG